MRTFKNVCAQGDIYITKVADGIPAGYEEVKPTGNNLIVTHSETGHHHVMEAPKVKMYKLPDDIMKCLLVVNEQTTLKHLREHDTHESILFDKGTYQVNRQQENSPEGWRMVQD